MPSIKDVAREAGVSYTTVSHVINGTRPVTESTAERVREAIDRLGYVPNRMARSLRRGKTWTIGVLAGHPTDGLFQAVMGYAGGFLAAEGYRMEFVYSAGTGRFKSFENVRKREIDAIEEFIRNDADAIILNSARTDAELKEALAELGKPCVLFQRNIDGAECCGVTSDDYAGGYAAAAHLIEAGCRRIAVFSGFAYRSHAVNARIHGIRAALEESGMSLPRQYRIKTMYSEEETYKGTLALMAFEHPPDGILCYSDFMAMTVIRALADLGKRVPRDVSVVGYDDIPLARLTVPRLTTIRQNPAEMGRIIAEKTLEGVNLGKSADSPPPLPVELVPRESTKRTE